MPTKVEIQINSLATREELEALQKEIRSIEGFEAFDLVLPTAPLKTGELQEMWVIPPDKIYEAVICGIIHFAGEKTTERIYKPLSALIKKFLSKDREPDSPDLEMMSSNDGGIILTTETDSSESTIFFDSTGNENDISGRKYSIDPEHTHAILIGVSKYKDQVNFPPIPPVAGNLKDLCRVLNNRMLMGLPKKNIHPLHNETSGNILASLNDISRTPGIKTLLIYYTGHGYLTTIHDYEQRDVKPGKRKEKNKPVQKLSLIAFDTRIIANKLNSDIPYSDVEDIVKSSPAAQKIIILDACHSGLAAQGPEANEYDFKPVYGTYTLASTSAKDASYFNPQATHTHFTGFMLQLFREGVKNINTMLSLNDLYTYTTEKLKEEKCPVPKRNFDVKNVSEQNFFISYNLGFDLKELLKRPYLLLKEGKEQEADIEYFRLIEEYPEEKYPALKGWDTEYKKHKKEALYNNLVAEADLLFYKRGRFFYKRKIRKAYNKYFQALNVKPESSSVRAKMHECEKILATSTTPLLKYIMGGLVTLALVIIGWYIMTIPAAKDITPDIKKIDSAKVTPPVTNKDSIINILTLQALTFENNGEIQNAINSLKKAQLEEPTKLRENKIDSLYRQKNELLSNYYNALSDVNACDDKTSYLRKKIIAIDPDIASSKVKKAEDDCNRKFKK